MSQFQSAKTRYYLRKILRPWNVFCSVSVRVWHMVQYMEWWEKLGLLFVVVFGVLWIALALFELDYSSTYRDFVRVNGEPVGLGEELSDEEMPNAGISFRLVRKGLFSISREEGWFPRLIRSRVAEVVVNRPVLNSSASALPLEERLSAFGCFGTVFGAWAVRGWEFKYDRRKGLCRETARNGFFDGALITVEYVPQESDLGIRQARVTISPPGLPALGMVFDARFCYDSHGHESRLELSGEAFANAQEIVRLTGIVPIQRFAYDVQGRILSERYYDSAERPCSFQGGCAGWRVERDEQGREVFRSWFGEGGFPASIQRGIASCRRTYLRNRHVEERYYDAGGKPCSRRTGDAGFIVELDDAGRHLFETWIGSDGKPMQTLYGFAHRRFGYDRRGHCTSIEMMDAEGRSCRDRDGVARIEMRYDIFGSRIETRYLDVDQTALDMISLPFCQCSRQDVPAADLNLWERTPVCQFGEYCIDNPEKSPPDSRSLSCADFGVRTMTVARRGFDGSYCIDKVEVPAVALGLLFRRFQVSKDEWQRVLHAYSVHCEAISR